MVEKSQNNLKDTLYQSSQYFPEKFGTSPFLLPADMS